MQLESVCSLPVDELLLTRLAFTPDGRYFLLGHKDLTLYEVLSGKAVRVFPFDAFLASISFSRDGRYVGCVNENDGHPRTPGLAKVFDMDTGGVVLEVRTRFPVEAGCFVEDPAGIVFLYKETLLQSGGGSGTDTRVRARRLPSGEPAPSLNLTGWDVRQLAAGSAVTLLGLDTTGKTYEVEGANLNVHQFQLGVCSYPACEKLRAYGLGIGAGLCRFSPDGRFLAIEKISFQSNRHELAWLDVEKAEQSSLLPLEPDVVPAVTFSEDGGQFACLTEEPESPGTTLRLWDSASREQLGQTMFGSQYHAIALNWRTRRVAGLGGGRCEIGLIHL